MSGLPPDSTSMSRQHEPDDTDSERLADRLLGGEARRVARPGVGEAVAVGALLLAEQPLVGARQPLEQPADARRLDDVDAEAEEQAAGRDGGNRTRHARAVGTHSTVTVLARLRGWSTLSPLMPAMW